MQSLEIKNSCGLSQKELAKIGMTQQQYFRYEVGVNKIKLEKKVKIFKNILILSKLAQKR